MSKLSIKARLYVNLAVLVAALAVVCGVGLRGFGEANARMEKLYQDNLLSISRIDEIFQRSLQSQQYRLEAYVHRDPAYTAQNYEQVKAFASASTR